MGGGLFPYTTAPRWTVGDKIDVTAGIRTLERNIDLFDLVTRNGRDLAQGHAPGDNIEQVADNPLEWLNGSYRYRTGMTTLTIIIQTTNVVQGGVNPRLRIRINGIGVLEQAFTNNAVNTFTYNGLGTLGSPDGQVMAVTLQIYDANGAQPAAAFPSSGWPGRFYYLDGYVSPVSAAMPTIWPGTPSFTIAGGLDATKLTQLSNASNWLAARLNLVPMSLFQQVRAAPGLFWQTTTDPRWAGGYPIWTGGMGQGRGVTDRLKADFSFVITNNVAESFSLRINGTAVQTIGPYTAGQRAVVQFNVSLTGYASTTPLRVEIVSVISAAAPEGLGRPSRYTVERVWAERSTVAAITSVQETFSYELTTIDTLTARLNSLGQALADIKSRIDSAPDLYDRARIFRRGYGYNAGERVYFANRHLPRRTYRIGAALIVFGSNVSIGYGPQTIVPPAREAPDGEYGVTFAYTETLMSGDQLGAKLVSLDALAGLEMGESYTLTSGGDSVIFAAEYLLR